MCPHSQNILTTRSPSPDPNPAPGLFGGIIESVKSAIDLGKTVAHATTGKRDLSSQVNLEERGVNPLEIVKGVTSGIAKIFIREDASELQERGVNPLDIIKSVTGGLAKIIVREPQAEEGMDDLD